MNKAALEKRLKALEQTKVREQVKLIELVDPVSGEVGAVIPIGGNHKESATAVTAALEFKHRTNPPRQLVSRPKS